MDTVKHFWMDVTLVIKVPTEWIISQKCQNSASTFPHMYLMFDDLIQLGHGLIITISYN